MKTWEMENTDIVRFAITREQWNLLIEAIAGAAVWASSDKRDVVWNAFDVLKNAEVDIEASKLVKTLTDIAERTKNKTYHNDEVIHEMAMRGLSLQTNTRTTGGE